MEKLLSSVDLGDFDWEQEIQTEFVITNVGEAPLVIIDVVTSCGCLTAEYSKDSISPGKDMVLKLRYKADRLGRFNKAIAVYCNASTSPIQLKIRGNAVDEKK